MHTNIKHTFYFYEDDRLDQALEQFVEQRLTSLPPFDDISMFVPPADNFVVRAHDAPLFCISFDIVLEAPEEHAISEYNHSGIGRTLFQLATEGELRDLYVMDHANIDVIYR